MHELTKHLLALADTLDSCERNHPLCSAKRCRQAAKAVEYFYAMREQTWLLRQKSYALEYGHFWHPSREAILRAEFDKETEDMLNAKVTGVSFGDG